MIFDSLTMNVCSRPTSDVIWSKSAPNWSEIKQSAAKIQRFKYLKLGGGADAILDFMVGEFRSLCVLVGHINAPTLQISSKSNNPLRVYCDLNVEHLKAARYLGFDRKLTFKIPRPSGTDNAPSCKFSTQSAMHGWIIDNLVDFCRRYVMLWPWPLTHWTLSFVVHRVSRVSTVYKMWAKSNNPRVSYSWFTTFLLSNFKCGSTNYRRVIRDVWTEVHQMWVGHRIIMGIQTFCFRFQISRSIMKRVWLRGEWCRWGNWGQIKFRTFWPLVKIRGGVREMSD